MNDKWKVEDRFREWGKPLRKTGDDFDDWALQIRKEAVEATLDEELRELFIEDLKNEFTGPD